MKPQEHQKTQGQIKAERYIEDLVRNRNFVRLLKNVNKSKRFDSPSGKYEEWSEDEKKRYDYINNELVALVKDYEALRKRCRKLLNDKGINTRIVLAEEYHLDNDMIEYANVVRKGKQEDLRWLPIDKPEMCRIVNRVSAELDPLNKGGEIIHLHPRRQIDINAFPVALAINPKASKRDILDFIEKRWAWIDASLTYFEGDEHRKVLKYRTRKFDQKMLDFIWSIRGLSLKKIKQKLDDKYPSSRLVYFEINNLIQSEKKRRLGDL